MKIFVTGGAGYIGSGVTALLKERGHEVVVYDNLSRGLKSNVPAGVRFVLGDIRDHDLVSRVLKDSGAEAVFHFAAKISVPESMEKPFDYLENNVAGGLSLLRACRARGVRSFVFSSTAAVYGDFTGDKVDEDEPLRPMSPYGETKAQFEMALRSLAREWPEFRFLSLRYFNVAGADLAAGRGPVLEEKSTNLMTAAAQAALGLRPGLDIFGDDYATPDGSCIRDFIHYLDLLDLHILGFEALLEDRVRGALNCGYGRGVSVKEVASEMRKVSERDFPVKMTSRRAGDIPSMVADTRRLQELLKWSPRHQNLTELCRSTYDWVRSKSVSV